MAVVNKQWDKYLHDLKSKSACIEGGVELLHEQSRTQRREILFLLEESASDFLKLLAELRTKNVETLD